jgi:4-amino-4-deoxy-L-arabinose transferase-like glycosyltransferase
MKPSYRRPLLLCLVLAAFALRVFGLDRQSLWRDEVDAIYFAVRNLEETLSMFVQAAQNGPLYFLSLRPWFALMGTWEFVLRFPSAVAGTLSVPLLWQVGRLLLPQPQRTEFVALVAAALLAFNPYQVWYGQEGKMYATITCLMLLSTWFWLRGVAPRRGGLGGGGVWVGYWLTVTVAMYSHLLMVLVIPLHLVWFLLAWPASKLRWRGYAMALAGLTLPYLPMVWWHWWLLTSPEKLSGFNFTPLSQVLEGLVLNHARGFVGSVAPLWLAPLFFLGAAGLLLGLSQIARGAAAAPETAGEAGAGADASVTAAQPGGLVLAPWRRLALLITWLVLPVVLIYLISLRQPVFTERYVIWIGPAALLAVALGLRVVAANSGRLGPAAAALLLLYTLSVWGYINWQQKTLTIKYDLRGAVQYVQAHRAPDELLILQIPHQEWSFRYYSDNFSPNPFAGSDARLGVWMQGPYTNYGKPDDQARAELDAQMRAWTAGQPAVWLMLSEAEMWDSRRLLDEWLNQHGTVVDEVDLPGVTVRRYQMKGQ